MSSKQQQSHYDVTPCCKEDGEAYYQLLKKHFDQLSEGINCPFPSCRSKEAFFDTVVLSKHYEKAGHKKKIMPFIEGDYLGILRKAILQDLGLFIGPQKQQPAVEVDDNEEPPTESIDNFKALSDRVRNGEKMKAWRYGVWNAYMKKHQGIPPCYHCHDAEATQVHHACPLFFEIVLGQLKGLGLSAKEVMSTKDNSLILKVEEAVYQFHMEGSITTAPYCRTCNMDAESKRKTKSKRST